MALLGEALRDTQLHLSLPNEIALSLTERILTKNGAMEMLRQACLSVTPNALITAIYWWREKRTYQSTANQSIPLSPYHRP